MYVLCCAFLIGLDLAIKFFIKNNLLQNAVINTFLTFLKITHTQNRGIAFGMFAGFRMLQISVSIIFIFCVFMLFFSSKNKNSKLLNFAYVFIIAGGVANLIERLIFGFVTDYIMLSFFPPVFNLADILLTLGVLSLLIKNTAVH